MNQTKRKQQEQEQMQESDKWQDIYEVAKFTGSVHGKTIQEELSEDYILAKLDDTKKEQLLELYDIAHSFRMNVLHPVIRERVFNTIMKEAHAITILNRNVSDNYMAKLLMRRSYESEEEDETEEKEKKQGMLGRLLSFNKKKGDAA